MQASPESAEAPSSLGIIAGKGAYPLELARSARAQGVTRIFAVAFKRETDRRIEALVDEVKWIYVGQFGPFIQAFADSGVNRAVMAGQITPGNLFNVRFDKPMRELLARLDKRNADTIFGAIGEELSQVGVELQPASLFMEESMPGPGVLTQRAPDTREADDMAFGLDLARQTSHLQIGQTVVVKEGTVLAVEAFEGTDDTIRRAGKVGKGRGVVVKVARPGHDARWDIPVIGTRTLRCMIKAKATALALEAGRAILLESDKVIQMANAAGIAIEVMDTGTPL